MTITWEFLTGAAIGFTILDEEDLDEGVAHGFILWLGPLALLIQIP